MTVQRPDDDRGHREVGERQREHELPGEAQQLVVAKARQRPAHEDLEAAHDEHLDQEHDELDHDDRAVAESAPRGRPASTKPSSVMNGRL